MTRRSNNAEKFSDFRKKIPFFAFEEQQFRLGRAGLSIRFTFNLADQYKFYPSLFIPRKACFLPDKEIIERLPLLVFHLGMIELISYWKAACPPVVLIKPFGLFPEQIRWWKSLYYHGLGEFLYLNGLHTGEDNLMELQVASSEKIPPGTFPLDDSVLIPVGGGKDSAVTLELLAGLPGALPLILNPRGASLRSIALKGFGPDDFFEIRREIDPELLRLNDQGFLNGHTPFSALLGFLTVLASAMTGHRFIALSNESSASEPTIPGTTINHQYSKSYAFETGFRDYIASWIHPDINYFSFLRPLNEWQIASMFARFRAFHPVFRSCNVGSKRDEWCGKCSKCLFTWIMLAPFLTDGDLRAIFGREIADDPELLPYLEQLTGLAEEKPFECVGTLEEVNAALHASIETRDDHHLPLLLDFYRKSPFFKGKSEGTKRFGQCSFAEDHHLPPLFQTILKDACHG